MANEPSAALARAFHPLRFQRWSVSDLNPWVLWLGPAAEMVRSQRQALGPEAPLRQIERMMSELVSASFDYYREMRDALSEALFYQIYGNLFSLYLAGQYEAEEKERAVEARKLPAVEAALSSLSKGGYPAAVARVFALLARDGGPYPLEKLHLKRELAEEFAGLLPAVARHQQRRIRGEQDIIVRYEPARALETLPLLLAKPADRARLRVLLKRLLADKRVAQFKLTPAQGAMLERIHKLLARKTPAAAVPSRRGVKAEPVRALGTASADSLPVWKPMPAIGSHLEA